MLSQSHLFLLLAAILSLAACTPQYSSKVPPKVVNGEIDLTGWDFEKDGPVKLDGDWLFAWEKFVEPASWEELQEQMTHRLQLPGYWNNLNDPANPGQNLKGTGYASYALRIIGGKAGKEIGLALSNPQVASEIQVLNQQGRVLNQKKSGIISRLRKNEIPLTNGQQVLKFLSTDNETFTDYIILIKASNHHNFKGGVFAAPDLNFYKKLLLKKDRQSQFQDFMAGILFIVFVYHLILFTQRRKDRSAMYFSLVNLAIGLRLFAMGIAQRAGLNDSVLAYISLTKLEYASMPIIVVTFSLFLQSVAKNKLQRNLVIINLFIATFLILLTLFTSPIVFVEYLYLYQLQLLFFAITEISLLFYLSLKKNLMARVILFALFLCAVGGINDILHASQIINSIFVAPYTLILFILLQAGLISSKNTRAHQTADHLSERLANEVAQQTRKLNRIQYLSQQIQNKTTLEEIEKNLKSTLYNEYGIENYMFFVLDTDCSKMYAYSISLAAPGADKIIAQLREVHLDITDPKSTYATVIRKKRALYLPRLPDTGTEKFEMKFRSLLKMKSMYLIPLSIDEKVFGVFALSDSLLSLQNGDIISLLTKEQRKDIEQLSGFISSAFYQALQKEQIKQAQEAASRAKNEAAINQLAAHLAHEVNNPLNYISTGKIIQQDSFEKYHEMILNALTGEDKDSIIFKKELQSLEEKFKHGIEQSNEGQGRIAKVIAEIRAITGVDGLHVTSFDLAPLLYEELVYSLIRNQVTQSNLKVQVTGTEQPLQINSNTYILARSIRTIVSNCIHFARQDRGDHGELYIDCYKKPNAIYIDIGNNSYSIKTKDLSDLFNLEKAQAYGTEQIGLGMIKELLHKINAELVLADHGRKSGRVVFQLQVPLEV